MGEGAELRSRSRGRIIGAVVLLGSVAVACGKAARSEGGDDPSASGGALTSGSGGVATGIVAGQGGSGAVSAALPDATVEEHALLEPLFIDSDQIEGAELSQLIEMGASIGVARGYAMCRCVGAFTEPLDLMACARAEAGILAFTLSPPQTTEVRLNQELARCLQEEAVERPWFADALRCALRWYQEDGRGWLELCSLPGFEGGDSASYPQTPPRRCPGMSEEMHQDFDNVMFLCRNVAYCDDGTRVSFGRCSGTAECPDLSDERGCYDIVGYDMVRCGDEVASPRSFCSLSSCGDEPAPPLCDEAWPERLLCPDGTELPYFSLCNREDDCGDGADERYCFR